jgi:hypothetical protein
MPPKLKIEDITEALLDSKVLEAVANALNPLLSVAIESALEKRLDVFNSTLRQIKADMGRLSTENAELKKQVSASNQRIDELERYSRSENLIIRGLPELSAAERASASPSSQDSSSLRVSHQSVETSVTTFLKDVLHLEVEASDISTAHRLKAGPKDTTRPIIVRFTSRRVRNTVYGAKKLLKGASSKVFISEHLTKLDSDLYYEARRLLRDKKIFAAWTQNGLVHVRFSPDPTSKATIVRCRADLALRP